MARSEWIGFVDSDDYIESQMFESMLKAGESMNSDIVCCNFSLLYKDKAITNKTIFNNDYKVSSRNEAMVHIAKGNINTFAISKLYRRMLFNDIRYPLVKTMEDVYTTHKLFQAANSVTSTGRAFYYYRQRRSSLTGVINEEFCKNLFEAHLMRIEDYLALNLFIAESEYPNLVFSLMRLHAIANSKTLKGQIKEALIKWKAICGIRLTGFKGVILSFALNLLFINENMFDLIWNSVHKFMHYIKKRNSSLYA
jgi:glycosyltransferase involved in cell wall biosynthesis